MMHSPQNFHHQVLHAKSCPRSCPNTSGSIPGGTFARSPLAPVYGSFSMAWLQQREEAWALRSHPPKHCAQQWGNPRRTASLRRSSRESAFLQRAA